MMYHWMPYCFFYPFEVRKKTVCPFFADSIYGKCAQSLTYFQFCLAAEHKQSKISLYFGVCAFFYLDAILSFETKNKGFRRTQHCMQYALAVLHMQYAVCAAGLLLFTPFSFVLYLLLVSFFM